MGQPNYHVGWSFRGPLVPRCHFAAWQLRGAQQSNTSAGATLLKRQPAWSLSIPCASLSYCFLSHTPLLVCLFSHTIPHLLRCPSASPSQCLSGSCAPERETIVEPSYHIELPFQQWHRVILGSPSTTLSAVLLWPICHFAAQQL